MTFKSFLEEVQKTGNFSKLQKLGEEILRLAKKDFEPVETWEEWESKSFFQRIFCKKPICHRLDFHERFQARENLLIAESFKEGCDNENPRRLANFIDDPLIEYAAKWLLPSLLAER